MRLAYVQGSSGRRHGISECQGQIDIELLSRKRADVTIRTANRASVCFGPDRYSAAPYHSPHVSGRRSGDRSSRLASPTLELRPCNPA